MTLLSLIAAMVAAAASQSPASGEILTKEQAEARLANCGTRKFESIAEFEIDGKPKRRSRRRPAFRNRRASNCCPTCGRRSSD